jgi:hypothetical protein
LVEVEEAEELGLLLDGLAESEEVPPEAPPSSEPAVADAALETEPAEELGGLLETLPEDASPANSQAPAVEAVMEPETEPEDEPEIEPVTTPEGPFATAGNDLDQMLSSFLETAPAREEAPPASRLDIKFQAAPPKVEAAAETRAVIDLAALADDPRDLRANLLDRDVERLEHARGEAFLFAQQPEQDVLRADVVVLQGTGLVLSQDDDLTSPFGEALKHRAEPSGRRQPVR